MKTKFFAVTLIGVASMLSGCEGSLDFTDDAAVAAKLAFEVSLADTDWEQSCIPEYDDGEISAYNSVKLSINTLLVATYELDMFSVTDDTCSSSLGSFSASYQFEITEAITSDESIDAYGVNATGISNLYSLIYKDGEKLYLGQDSDSNLGETEATRHTSLAMDYPFTQVND